MISGQHYQFSEPAMELSPEGIIAYITGYIETMPSAIMQGDIFALTITLIVFFIAVVVINQLTGLLIRFLKKAILFIIVTLAFWQFILMFSAKVNAEGLTTDTLIFGAAGFVIGIVAFSTAFYVALRSFKIARKKPVGGPATEEPVEEIPAVAAGVTAGPAQDSVPEAGPGGTLSAMKETLSINNLKSDKSLGTVLAYLVIAQFGVYSSVTLPAPSLQVGLAFFGLFVIAGLFFIHYTYNNYRTGIRHLVGAIVVGTIVAVILGHFWGNIPLDQLLSPAFFQSSALVALVTGLALSLFMGGKG